MLATALSRAVEWTLPAVPGVLDGPVSAVAGTLAYVAAPGARQAVRANITVIAPTRRDRELVVRRVFVHQARHYIETFRIGRLSADRLLAQVDIHGWSHFTRAFARGRGVVLVSAHLGPVALCGQILAAQGYEVTIPVEAKSSELGRAVDRARTALGGIRMVETSSALGIHRVIRRGGILGMLADRAVTGIGVRVPFFGREALLPSAHVSLALRTGAALVPAFAHRDGGRLHATVEPELDLPSTGDREADVSEGVRRWAEVLERHVRRAPEQWSVFAPVWDQ